MNLAHTQRLAVWAEHGEPKAYGGSDLMREDVQATVAEIERMAELLYRLHVAPGEVAHKEQKAQMYRRALLLACNGDEDQLAYFVSEAESQS